MPWDREWPFRVSSEICHWIRVDDPATFVFDLGEFVDVPKTRVNQRGTVSAQCEAVTMLAPLVYCYAIGTVSSRIKRMLRASRNRLGSLR